MAMSGPDYDKGIYALRLFYDHSKKLYPSVVNYSFDDFQKTLESRNGQRFFVDGFGFAIHALELSDSKVKNAMEGLAKKSSGKIPARNIEFQDYLLDQTKSVDFVDMITYVTKESAKDLVSGTQAIGDQIITGLKISKWLALPILFLILYWALLSLKKNKLNV